MWPSTLSKTRKLTPWNRPATSKRVFNSHTVISTKHLLPTMIFVIQCLLSFTYAMGMSEAFEVAIDPIDSDYYDSIPTSFAVLINFGLAGKQRNLYSSYSHNERCPQGRIWDPFNNQCRQLYCHDNYQLQDLTCVQATAGDNDDASLDRPNLKFLDADSKYVNVTLEFKLNETRTDDWLRDNTNTISYQFIEQFASSWELDDHRVIDIDLAFKPPMRLTMNFLLVAESELYTKKTDSVLKPLSDAVVNHRLSYTIAGLEFRALHIHTSVAEVADFCLEETDMPIWYWNDDFILLDQDNLTTMHVLKTGRIYYPGEFMGSVLYIENGAGKNISSNAVVCEQTLINETCAQILFNRSEYEFVDGKYLFTPRDQHYHDHYELTTGDGVLVCLPSTGPTVGDGLNAKIQAILSVVLMIISITLLTIMLVTFLRLSIIRRTLNGFNTINLVFCLSVMQLTFLANQYIDFCNGTAVVFHFFILTTISWSCVIAYDMFQVFARKKNLLAGRPNTSHARIVYGLVAYLVPFVIVTVAKLADTLNINLIGADYGRVVRGSNFCWMRARRAIIIYFIIPVAIALVFNLFIYLRIIFNIRSNIRSFVSFRKLVVRIPSDSSQGSAISVISSTGTETTTASRTALTSNAPEVKLNYNQTSIYIKLSIPLGFTWAIALFSPLIPAHHSVVLLVMSYLFILANTSQGVVLFFAFGVYRKMFARNTRRNQ